MTRNIRSRALAALVVLSVAGPASADVAEVFRQMFATASQVPHPSIVQVLAPDKEAISRGSGTLIHVDGKFGYVITNWHVVRDAEQEVLVIFPDGYQSLARILKMNKDWDLALLLVWAGTERPMPLATVGPRPGDQLQIAGYGAGDFRAQRGQFSTFAAPQPDMPFEMFEVMATARQGDSGGPIINQRGELVGVLFGAGDGRTTGTQIGRVRMFVNEAFDELRERVDVIANQQPSEAGRLAAQGPAAWTSTSAATAGQGPLPFVETGQQPPSNAGWNPSLAAVGPSSIAPGNPVGQPWLDAPAPIGNQSISAASDAWRAAPSNGYVKESIRVADVGSATPPAPRNVEARQAHQDSLSTPVQPAAVSPHDDIVQQPAQPVPSLESSPVQLASEADLRKESSGVNAVSERPAASDQIVSRRARPAEVSREEFVQQEGFFQANRGTRADGPPMAAITSDRDAANIPQAAGGMAPSGPATVPISAGVTWEQLRSFFAAVGVFAVLHAIAKTFALAPATKSRR